MSLVILSSDVVHVELTGNSLINELIRANLWRSCQSVSLFQEIQTLDSELDLWSSVLFVDQSDHKNGQGILEFFNQVGEAVGRDVFQVVDL